MMTDEQKAAVIARYSESATKVADALGLTPYQVRNTWHAAKVAGLITESKAPRPLSKVEKCRLVMYHKAGHTVDSIARMLDRPRGTVGSAIQRLQEAGVLRRRYNR